MPLSHIPSVSSNLVSTDVPRPPTVATSKVEINYNHHHILSFCPDSTISDPATTLRALTSVILSNSPGRLTPSNGLIGRNDVPPSTSPQKDKLITVNGMAIHYNAETLPDPPTLSYRTREDLEKLVKDWTDSSLLTINGVGIPLCLWRKLYSRTRPKAWDRMKDQWGKFRFIVGGFKSFASPEEFWRTMSSVVTTDKKPEDRISYTRISDLLRGMRNARDESDVIKARAEYSDNFDTIFAYRKGGKQLVLKKSHDIARHYRALKETSVYWDDSDGE
jgi:hypothetical protein